jgi:hypothetical protein
MIGQHLTNLPSTGQLSSLELPVTGGLVGSPVATAVVAPAGLLSRWWWLLAVCLLGAWSVQAGQSVALTWKASPDPRATGYVLVYGNASGAYTQSTNVGKVTQSTITGLVKGRTYYFAVYAYSGASLQSELSNEVSYRVKLFNGVSYEVLPAASVVSRMVFYNGSAWDGFDPAATASDDAAIAVDKTALLPGQTATFGNYTSYDRGLTGVMVDVSNLGQTVDVTDFDFRVGNDNDPDGWPSAPAPSISIRPEAGVDGSDRITFIWPDNVIQDAWLQVTVRATPNTRLLSPDVFYFGNAIGSLGNSLQSTTLTWADVLLVYHRMSWLPVTVTEPLDFDRDQYILYSDVWIAQHQYGAASPALQLIDLSGVTTNALSAVRGADGTPLSGAQLASASNGSRTSNSGASIEILSVTTLVDRSIHVVIRYPGAAPGRVWRSTTLLPSDWQELPTDWVKVRGNGFYDIRLPAAQAGAHTFLRFDSRLAGQ